MQGELRLLHPHREPRLLHGAVLLQAGQVQGQDHRLPVPRLRHVGLPCGESTLTDSTVPQTPMEYYDTTAYFKHKEMLHTVDNPHVKLNWSN